MSVVVMNLCVSLSSALHGYRYTQRKDGASSLTATPSPCRTTTGKDRGAPCLFSCIGSCCCVISS